MKYDPPQYTGPEPFPENAKFQGIKKGKTDMYEATAIQRPLEPHREWPDPTEGELASPQFEAIWQCIKNWDINVPDVYVGYCGANGNHVVAILHALQEKT